MGDYGDKLRQERKLELNARVEEFFNHAHGKGGRFTSGGGSSSGSGSSHTPTGFRGKIAAKRTEKIRSSVVKAIEDKIQGNKNDLQDTEKGGLQLRVGPGRPKGHTLFPGERVKFRQEARSSIHGFEKMKEQASKASLKELKKMHI